MEDTKDLPPPYECSPYLQQNEYRNPYGQPSGQFMQPQGQYMPQQLIQQQPLHQLILARVLPFERVQTPGILSQPAAPTITTLPYNYSSLAWLSCLLCFLPLGIVAIVKSCEVDIAISAGNMERAQIASQAARRFGYIAVYIGLALYIAGVVMGAVLL